MSRHLVGGLMAFVISGVAFAQAPPAPAMPKQYQDMAAAVAAAQAKAVRPGDQALGCAAIEKELMATMNDPAIQTYAGRSASVAQLQAGGLGRGATTPHAAAALAAALSSNAAVAAAMAGAGAAPLGVPPQQPQAMQQALAAQGMTPQQIQAMQAAALANPQVPAALQVQAQALANPQAQAALAAQSAQLAQMQDPAAQMALMTAAMPQILRSQRLVGLAMAKGCTSLGGNSAAAPAE